MSDFRPPQTNLKNVWSVDKAVDEVMRLRRLLKRIEAREAALRRLGEQWLARATHLESAAAPQPPAGGEIRRCSQQLFDQLFVPSTFTNAEDL